MKANGTANHWSLPDNCSPRPPTRCALQSYGDPSVRQQGRCGAIVRPPLAVNVCCVRPPLAIDMCCVDVAQGAATSLYLATSPEVEVQPAIHVCTAHDTVTPESCDASHGSQETHQHRSPCVLLQGVSSKYFSNCSPKTSSNESYDQDIARYFSQFPPTNLQLNSICGVCRVRRLVSCYPLPSSLCRAPLLS